MQPLLTRTTRVTSCAFTLSRTLSAPCSSTTRKDARGFAKKRVVPTVFRRFKDFYKRFYSDVSETAAIGGKVDRSSPEPRKIVRDGSKDQLGKDNTGSSEGTQSKSNSDDSHRQPSREPLGNSQQRQMPAEETQGTLGDTADIDGQPGAKVWQNSMRAEESVRDLVKQMNDHDYLIKYIERSVDQKARLVRNRKNIEKRAQHEELQELHDVYRSIERKYYNTREFRNALESPEGPTLPYLENKLHLPAFPNYLLNEEPTVLNRALMDLFSRRPYFPQHFLLKMSYNLLISPSPPDVKTYNILIHGFTRMRQNTLAHIVIRNMLDSGVQPDPYSIVAILNLTIKTGDYETFARTIRVLNNSADQGLLHLRKTSRVVLETMIHGAARFGRIKRVRAYLRILKRDYPEDSAPGLICSTSLLKFWTGTKNWTRGRETWEGIIEPDLRAYHQMVKLCIACGKKRWLSEIVYEAEKKGWNAQEVVDEPPFTRKLFSSPETRIPRLSRITPRYRPPPPKAHRKRLKTYQPEFWQDFVCTVENSFENNWLDGPLASARTKGHVPKDYMRFDQSYEVSDAHQNRDFKLGHNGKEPRGDYYFGAWLSSVRIPQETFEPKAQTQDQNKKTQRKEVVPDKPKPPLDEEKSAIWQEVLARRLNILKSTPKDIIEFPDHEKDPKDK